MVAALLLLTLACGGPAGEASSHSKEPSSGYALAGGRWWGGDGRFEAKEMYVVDRELRERAPAAVDSVVDLAGGYVVPPFGDAHSHRPSHPDRAEMNVDFFLDAGIYYVMQQGSPSRYHAALDSLMNRRGRGVDVIFANGMIASPQSHAVDLWRNLASGSAFRGLDPERLDGDAYFVVRSEEELDRQWPRLLETAPDFVKVMIEHSGEYEMRRDDPRYLGRSGLDPGLIPDIVERAHARGLRVSAHIETARDFGVAVSAGVDVIAHLPGYDIPADHDVARYRITPRDAELAAERDVVVITTTLLSEDGAEHEPGRLARMRENHRHNLRLLQREGVRLAVGSDVFSRNAVDEALNLASLDVFDPGAILEILSRDTPGTIFPDRRVGSLEDGAEASFLVLRSDPLVRLEAIQEIGMRVKDGVVLGR